MSWLSPPAVSQRKAAVSQCSPRARSPRLLPRARALQLPCRLRPACACCTPSAPQRLRATWLYRGLAGHCITIQSSLAFAPQSQYTSVYCDTTPAFPAFSCNTINCIVIQFQANTPILQYNPTTFFSAIQTSVLQYKNFFFHYNFSSPLSYNTIARLAIQIHNTIGQ